MLRWHWPQGSGRYSIYIANYASGNVGPHALIEMDVAASDPARGIVVLVDVAVQAGVSKYTGTALPWAGGERALLGMAGAGPRRRQGSAGSAGSEPCHSFCCLTAPSSGSPMAPGRDRGRGEAHPAGSLCPPSCRQISPEPAAYLGQAVGHGGVATRARQQGACQPVPCAPPPPRGPLPCPASPAGNCH